jgi:hypothetical protein
MNMSGHKKTSMTFLERCASMFNLRSLSGDIEMNKKRSAPSTLPKTFIEPFRFTPIPPSRDLEMIERDFAAAIGKLSEQKNTSSK